MRVAIVAILLTASAALAQGFGDLWGAPGTPGATGATECPPSKQWDSIEPSATDLRSLLFESRTLSSVGAYRVEVISGSDNDPNAIVSSATVSGGLFNFVLEPTAREGNWYQLCGKPVDSNGRQPWGCGCIEVKRTRYARPR